MGIDQLFVDPVAAALGQLVHIQLAPGEHDLAHGAVDLIAIDIDIWKVVVSPDLLNLAQRILQRPPIPQPDVLERRLVICGIGRLNCGLAGNSRCETRSNP